MIFCRIVRTDGAGDRCSKVSPPSSDGALVEKGTVLTVGIMKACMQNVWRDRNKAMKSQSVPRL